MVKCAASSRCMCAVYPRWSYKSCLIAGKRHIQDTMKQATGICMMCIIAIACLLKSADGMTGMKQDESIFDIDHLCIRHTITALWNFPAKSSFGLFCKCDMCWIKLFACLSFTAVVVSDSQTSAGGPITSISRGSASLGSPAQQATSLPGRAQKFHNNPQKETIGCYS